MPWIPTYAKCNHYVYLKQYFPEASSVVVSATDDADGSSITLSGVGISEIGSSGVWKWSTENIATQPVSFEQYTVTFTPNTGENAHSDLVFGGYLDQIYDQSPSLVADAVWNEEQSGHSSAGTFGLYLDSAVSAAGGGASAADVATEVWNRARGGHTGAGTFGLYLDAQVSGVDTKAGAIQAVTDNLPDSGALTGIAASAAYTSGAAASINSRLPASPASVGDIPTAAANADAVWDEPQAGHVVDATFGKYLDSQVSSAGGGATASDVADAVWDEQRGGHTGAGTFGLYLDSQVSAAGGGGGDATEANQQTIIAGVASVLSVANYTSGAACGISGRLPASPAAAGDVSLTLYTTE